MGGLAKTYIGELTRAEGRDGFAAVTLKNVEVTLPRQGSFMGEKQLNGVNGMTLQIGESSTDVNLAGVESSETVAKDYATFMSMTLPFRVSLVGTIHEVEQVRYTRDDTAQKAVTVHDANGLGVKVILHGYWAEEDLQEGQRWAFCFGEARGEKTGGEKTGEGVIWMFDSAYALQLPDQADGPVFREMLAW